MGNLPADKSKQRLKEKTKKELLVEVDLLRRRLAELEEAEEDRRIAEKALQESEYKFSEAFHSNAAMMGITTLQEGRFIEVNTAFVQTVGYDRSEVIGRTGKELNLYFDYSERDNIRQMMVSQGHVRDYETKFRTKTGGLIHGSLSVSLIKLGGVDCCLTIMHDITDRKRMETELRQSNETLTSKIAEIADAKAYSDSLIDSFTDALLMIDLDGIVRDANDVYFEMMGLTREEEIGKPMRVDRIVSKEDEEQAIERFKKTNAGTPIDTAEVTVLNGYGQEMVVEATRNTVRDASGNATMYLVTLRDITVGKQMEDELRLHRDHLEQLVEERTDKLAKTNEKLRQSEERYRAIFEQSADAITLIDPETGELIDFNDVVCENLGYERAELQNLHVSDIDTVYSPEELAQHTQLILKEGSGIMETMQQTKDGEIRQILTNTRLVTIARKKLLLSIWRDITDIRLRDEAEARARELEKLDRLRSALLASVSHELRTPLTIIKGISTSLLLTDVSWDENTRKDFLQSIAHEAETLTRIVENLEKMSKLEAGIISLDMRPCHISDIITKVSDHFGRVAKDHQLQIGLQSGMPKIKVDSEYIEDVLINLLSNAALFSDAGTRISIAAKHVNDQVIVSITDEGIGIELEHHEYVFDRFHRVESGFAHRRGGTGLGLSICKAIIERHNGRIWVESRPGEGSTFSFSLPTATA